MAKISKSPSSFILSQLLMIKELKPEIEKKGISESVPKTTLKEQPVLALLFSL